MGENTKTNKKRRTKKAEFLVPWKFDQIFSL